MDDDMTHGEPQGPQGAEVVTPAGAAPQEWPGGRRPPSDGLTEEEAGRRSRAGHGNDVEIKTGRSYAEIVRENVFNFINVLFFTLGILLTVLGRWLDALVSVAVILANTLVSLVQEIRAKRLIDRIAILTRPKASVVRDGALRNVDPSQIVLGDLLYLHPGDQVVVDGRVVGPGHFEVDESLLTGESDLVAKRDGDELLSGSFCATGGGYYEAQRVGLDSYANKLTARVTRYHRPLTPLQRQVNLIIRALLIVAIVFNALVWVRNTVTDVPFVESVRMSTVIVALIPNGLVLSIALAYALGAVRMLGKGMLIQQANAVESLSNVDVLCTDKTGTLTSNVLAVHDVVPLAADVAGLERLLGRYAASTGDANRTIEALQHAYEAERVEPTDEAAFSSQRKWSGLAFTGGAPGTYVLGAPEAVAEGLRDGDGAWQSQAEAWAAQGLRVLLFAGRPEPLAFGEPGQPPRLPTGLRPLALVAFRDELRPHVKDTLDDFAEAGIQLKIISGDDPATVSALARQAGVRPASSRNAYCEQARATAGATAASATADAATGPTPDLEAVSGHELEQLGPVAFADAAERSTVFGRVTPDQKQELVDALRQRDHYIAMVGDGVNDVIALKEAHVGVAMQGGSQASRGVADLVLLEDSFAALPFAFREGQRIINGMHDILRIFMVRIGSKALLIAIVSALGGFPLAPRQASLLSFVGAGVPAVALAAWARPGPTPKANLFRILARFVVPTTILLTLMAVAVYLIYAIPAESLRPGATEAEIIELALPKAQTATAVFASFCSILLIPLTVPPTSWWAGGAKIRGDWRFLALTAGLLLFMAGVLATSVGRTLFEITALPVWQYGLLFAAAVGWSLLCRFVWRSGLLDGWLGTAEDPGRVCPPEA